MATAKKAPAKRAPAKKRAASKQTAVKRSPAKAARLTFKDSADKAVNVYLGLIGMSIDTMQDAVEAAREQNAKRIAELEKRGEKLRSKLTKRIENMDFPEFNDMVDDVKSQFDKAQDQVEDAVDTVKDKYRAAKAA